MLFFKNTCLIKYQWFTGPCIIALSVLFLSCGSKWKKPANVEINFDLVVSEGSTSDLESGELLIDKATVTYNSLIFNGTRQQGEHSIAFEDAGDFTLSYDNGDYISHSIIKEIPQGTYDQMDFGQNIGMIVINAYYKSDEYGLVPITVTIANINALSIVAKENDGTEQVVLISDINRILNIRLTPETWLSSVSSSNWESLAEIQYNQNPDEDIQINSAVNPGIYYDIKNTLLNGITAVYQ